MLWGRGGGEGDVVSTDLLASPAPPPGALEADDLLGLPVHLLQGSLDLQLGSPEQVINSD
jgi:hypothetical protein